MIDVALIGAGAMGRLHAATVARHPSTRLARVYDVHAGRAEPVAARWGADVGLPEPGDWVIVATPAQTHAVVLRSVADHNVLVEKPLAPNTLVARGVVRDRLWVGHSERFSLDFSDYSRTVRTIVGSRCVVESSRGRDVDVIADLLVHDVDRLVNLVGGRPVACEVYGVLEGVRGLDRLTVDLTWAGGCATLSVDRVANEASRTFIVNGRTAVASAGEDALTRQLSSWILAVHGKTTQWGVATSAEALVAVEVCDQIREMVQSRAR